MSIRHQSDSNGGNKWIFHQFWSIYALLQLKDCSYSSPEILFLRVTYLYLFVWVSPHNCCKGLSERVEEKTKMLAGICIALALALPHLLCPSVPITGVPLQWNTVFTFCCEVWTKQPSLQQGCPLCATDLWEGICVNPSSNSLIYKTG